MTAGNKDNKSLAVELTNVSKSFKDTHAVEALDLRIPAGTTYGLLGPNGAGKTTTIRMILQIIKPDTGSISVFGKPVSADVLDRVGYLPEERGIYKNMTVIRLLRFFAELKGMPGREASTKAAQWLERFELADRANAKVKELSKGNQQKAQFIASILHEPDVMILDEPFSGLDPLNQQLLRQIIVDLRRAGKTIIFSTHIIEHAERICDDVCIIARGHKVADGSISQVKKEHGGEFIAISFEDGQQGGAELVERSPVVKEVRHDGNTLQAFMTPTGNSQELLHQLVSAGIRIKRFERTEPSLEQVFLERVGAAADSAGELRING
jgi:ABC-2 type transport system ATP-binding protein